MAAIFRESSAGQICRLFLGLKITPYVDEREGFVLPQQLVAGEAAAAQNNNSEPEPETNVDIEKDGSEGDSEKGSLNEDIEKDTAREPQQPSAKPDPNIVDWFGPGDEENPQNWSTTKKIFVFGQICLLTFSSQFNSLLRAVAVLTFSNSL